MAKITQETFDNAVQENINDLGLTPEEAIQEAVTQFEMQGVDLSSIVKELMITSDDSKHIQEEIEKLVNLEKNKAQNKDVIEQLEVIRVECDKGIRNRVEAGKAGAYEALINIILSISDMNVRKACLKTLISLMTKQPDLLDEKGIEIILINLKKEADFDIKKYTLKWTRECCVLHEMNRQNIFNAHILDNIKELLNDGTADILREVLIVMRALVLDDDVRVEFGKAHEHARVMASETLCTLTGLSSRFKQDELLINDLILTISALLVRTEFCKKVEDAGGLELIKDVMKVFRDSEKINRQCFKLIKSLAGNDECKVHMIQKGLAPVIIETLAVHKASVPTAVAGLASIAALCLRSPDNSRELYNAGAPAIILEIMKLHSNEKQIQKTVGWCIRNMVSRSRYQNETFLQLGAEQLLQAAMKKFKEIEYDVKAALRDLGCKVQLKEEWTGKGGALTTGRIQEE